MRFPIKAKWIENPSHDKNLISFRKIFDMAEGCKEAYLAICGLGFYEAYLNGERVSDEYYKPVFTDYEPRDASKNSALGYKGTHTVAFNVFAVTHLLKEGQNELVVQVGNGYYRNDDKKMEPYILYGDKKLIFEVYDKEGEVMAYSDENTEVAVTPMFSDLFLGDRWDFTKKELYYKNAAAAKPVDGKFVYYNLPNDRVEREIEPVGIKKVGGGTLYDFGINHSGGLLFSVKGARGSTLTVSFAEFLNDDGTPELSSGRSEHFEAPKKKLYSIDQRSEYVLSGETDSIFPLFCWHCYRYAYIECSGAFEISGMKSLFIHTDLKSDGSFSCSDENIMKIYDACVLTLKDNLHAGVLSDCPHREKRPYTGDGQVASEAMLYEFDAVAFYKKWLGDILCSQRDNGYIPNSAPYMSGGGGYAWGNAIVEVTDILYRLTGDKSVILLSVSGIEKWIEYIISTVVDGKENDYGEWLLGDWLSPEYSLFDIKLMSMLCLYRACEREAFFENVIGKGAKQKRYSALAARFKTMINDMFFNPRTCNYADGVQGENLLPLSFGVVPENKISAVCENIKRKYERNGFHVDTGIICTRYLFETLIGHGMSDIAYKILTQSDAPSYLSMLSGESTVSEHWSKRWPDYKRSDKGTVVKGGAYTSRCHPVFCSVLSTLYKYVAGLDLSRTYQKKVVFNFVFVNEFTSASAKKATKYGDACISWKREGKKVSAALSVPKGFSGEAEFGCEIKNLIVEGKGRIANKPGKLTLNEGVWNLSFETE